MDLSGIPWITVFVAIVLIVLATGTIIAFRKSRKKQKPDYKAFFVMGIIWLPFGIAMGNYALALLGLVFAVIGLANKKKWKKEPTRIGSYQKIMTFVLVALMVLLVVGIIFLLVLK